MTVLMSVNVLGKLNGLETNAVNCHLYRETSFRVLIEPLAQKLKADVQILGSFRFQKVII